MVKRNVSGFEKRLTAGAYRIAWRDEDVARLGKLYGLKELEALQIAKGVIAVPKVKALSGIITKADPSRWTFTASTGKPDRVGDIVVVNGIQTDDYRAAGSPWFWQHDHDRPIGRSVELTKNNGRLAGTMEFGTGIFPDAEMAAKAAAAKMCLGVSIGFRPLTWTPRKDAAGSILWSSVDLLEVSQVGVPCCLGCLLHAPAKSLAQQAADLRVVASQDRAAVAEAKRLEAVENYVSSTTPEQRRRAREAALLRIKGRA